MTEESVSIWRRFFLIYSVHFHKFFVRLSEVETRAKYFNKNSYPDYGATYLGFDFAQPDRSNKAKN